MNLLEHYVTNITHEEPTEKYGIYLQEKKHKRKRKW